MVKGLQDTVDVVADVQLTIGINQVLTERLEELGGVVLGRIRVEHFDLF